MEFLSDGHRLNATLVDRKRKTPFRGTQRRHLPSSPGRRRPAPRPQQRRHAALMAAATEGKALVDDACAKKAVTELTRE